MENKLEQLLNSLIEKGWKPFGTDNRVFKVLRTKNNWWYFDGGFGNEICFSLREIVSKESGLWQFVCENMLIEPDHMKQYNGYEYRIIQSALCDEDKLEDFLLNSIKID